ncbi:hypothetical protein ACFLUC_03315 [Chloroflexota bacterium]
MGTHVKIVGWLWILNGVLSILMFITGLAVINWPGVIPDTQVSILASIGALCFFLPGVIAYLAAGYGLLKYKGWARILAIILAILNLILFPIGTAIGIYTLVIMFNEETKALFSGIGVAPAEIEEPS